MMPRNLQSIPHIFTRLIPVYVVISSFVLIPGIISLLLFGLRPSIDFTGGSLLEVSSAKQLLFQLQSSSVQSLLGKGITVVSVQSSGVNQAIIRTKTITDEKKNEAISLLHKKDPTLKLIRFETLGPILGAELLRKTIAAVLFSLLLIAVFLGIRFPNWRYGVSAALATVHDGVVVLGIFSLLGHFFGVEVDVLFVTALLTILSFSVHDTIIVYDRIRERQRKVRGEDFEDTVNVAVFETLNRSLRNSLAILFMLLIVFLIGGTTLRWFIFALFIGTLTGTYSSTCVALPILFFSEKLKKRHSARLK